ncbi:hypothetical protein FQA39_LY04095 [Lamprigera yunnana]|nr:hypothetical protein FQA39_LY04095 [Lamprigera yunnana]
MKYLTLVCVFFLSCRFDGVKSVPQTRPKILRSAEYQVDNNSVEGATVLKSNLPPSVRTQLAASLASIYRSTSDPMQRLKKFRTVTWEMFPLYWTVVSNFDNVVFDSQYYIYLQIANDRVLAFGLT